MPKKVNPLLVHIRTKTATQGFYIPLEYCEKGYYLGNIVMESSAGYLGVELHVEAIQTNKSGKAINPFYQNRIDQYLEKGEDISPELMFVNKKWYFVNIEPFAKKSNQE